MTAALMFQGTTSDAGKSILTAALCRILFQEGYRVAPFKAQNMSLNSFVTRDGLEMGRAQVVQAQAARLDPDVRMNPVLLKPSSEMGCQVVVMGKPLANMRATGYVEAKPAIWQTVCAAYEALAREYDVMVLEGAGSPGEINLKAHDIVNMRMARQAGAAVLLVGDIERGGVFASMVGHFELMAEWERALLAGWVVNRFRGDASLLTPALEFMAARTGRPVVGVVPFLRDLGLPEEDSVSFKNGLFQQPRPEGEHVEIALVDLPHISNFTDVEPLLAEPDCFVRVVREAAALGNPDCILLPGSKNVLADLGWLRHTGLAAAIQGQAAAGVEIVGICGGYQMLGSRIVDSFRIESGGEEVQGLGLLPQVTNLAPEKTLVQRTMTHISSRLPVHGYEIHHGRTCGGGESLLTGDGDGGARTENGRIWGCYLHGLFDADPFRRWFIDQLRRRRGLAAVNRVLAPYDLEPAFDRLAAAVRQALDMDCIHALIDKS